MLQIDAKEKAILLDALEDLMYKLSLQLEGMKGEPLSKRRKELTDRQTQVEKLQHRISMV